MTTTWRLLRLCIGLYTIGMIACLDVIGMSQNWSHGALAYWAFFGACIVGASYVIVKFALWE
jgi:hypothetical protein